MRQHGRLPGREPDDLPAAGGGPDRALSPRSDARGEDRGPALAGIAQLARVT